MISGRRPRRAAAQKQRQYRFDDESEASSTVQSKATRKKKQPPKSGQKNKNYGGVLASLSNNNVGPKLRKAQPVKGAVNKNNKKGASSVKSDFGGGSTSYGEETMSTQPTKAKHRKDNHKIEPTRNNNVMTPPPKSVVIGRTMEVVSPPTCAFDRKKNRLNTTSSSLDDGSDEVSESDENRDVFNEEGDAISAIKSLDGDFLSPAATIKSKKPRKIKTSEEEKTSIGKSEDDCFDEEEDDDDETVELMTPRSLKNGSKKDFVDPNETILEDESLDEKSNEESEEEEEEEEEEESDEESEEMSDSEPEEEDDDDGAYGSEDDEYVPDDDDEESPSEDELSDYVVQETRSTRGRRPQRAITESADSARETNSKTENSQNRRKKTQASTPPKSPDSVSFDAPHLPIPQDEIDTDSGIETDLHSNTPVSTPQEAPSSPYPQDNDDDCDVEDVSETPTSVHHEVPSTPAPQDDNDDDHTEIEATPARNILQDLGSPQSVEAMVIEDDDDDDDDDDILIATIIDDYEVSNSREVDDIEICSGDGVFEPKSIRAQKLWQKDLKNESKSVASSAFHDLQEGEERSVATEDEIAEDFCEKSAVVSEEDEDLIFDADTIVEEKENNQQKDDQENKSIAAYVVEPAPSSEPIQLFSTPNVKKQPRKSFYRKEGKIKRGKWSLGSKIGIGSFGVVHVGMNTLNGTLMAVKRFKMDGAVTKDIRTEVGLLRSLEHKNIVRYLGAEMDKKYLHIFQEWVPGGSVATLLGKFGPFSLQVIRSYLSQSLAGLAYLHENDIMHRDIKGSNILVNDEGVVKLADFGASKKLANLQDNLMMSMTVRGTPYFMAPEVFEEKYSAKADVWGIGCVAFQMVTGIPPWKEKGFENPISLFNHIKKHQGPPPMKISKENLLSNGDKRVHVLFERMVAKCFQKDPSERPTVGQLIEDPFFIEMHEEGDDDTTHYRGIFSPGGLFSPGSRSKESLEFSRSSETSMSATKLPGTPLQSIGPSEHIGMSPSPLKQSPSPLKLSRNKSVSVVQWKTSFLSPPRPKRINSRARTTPSPARHMVGTNKVVSPKPDTSDWPDWAIAELQRAELGGESQTADNGNNLSVLMGSLALSEDSALVGGPNPFARSSNASSSSVDKSHLVGLNFLDQSSSIYEI